LIRLTVPAIRYEEVEQGFREILESGWLTNGPKVEQFERVTADYMKVPHAVAACNGTAALHLALLALGIGPGDEVVCSDYTFPASSNSIEFCGAAAVLCDVDIATYNMAPSDLEKRITEHTKAVMVVHQFGLSADMDSIGGIARARGLAIIEDAACAIGASYKGRFCGTIGNAGTFSYHPRKVLTTGEGGMVVTSDEAIAQRVASLRNHGMCDAGGVKTFGGIGYNYRLSELGGVVGLAQMNKLDWIVSERRRLAAELTERIADLEGVHAPVEPEGCRHIYQSFVVRLDSSLDRDRVITELRDSGVEATTGAAACHTLGYYQQKYGYADGDLPGSFELYKQTVTLPLYPGMTGEDVQSVAKGLETAVSRSRDQS